MRSQEDNGDKNHQKLTYYGATQELIDLRAQALKERGLKDESFFKQDEQSKKLPLLSCGWSMQQLRSLEPQMRVKWLDSNRGSPRTGSPPAALLENTSADSSPCEEEHFRKTNIVHKLSVEEVSKLIINTGVHNLHLVDSKKTDKNEKIPQEWVNVRELIIANCDPSLEGARDKASFKKYFKEKYQLHDHIKRFKIYPFVSAEKIEQIYYGGSYSFTIKLPDEIPAKFVHFNLTTGDKHKKYLGEHMIVGQLKLSTSNQNFEIKVVLRFLPLSVDKEIILHDIGIELMKVCRVEELFEYAEAKYGVIFAKDLETAEIIRERLTKAFSLKGFTQAEAQIAGQKKISLSKKNIYNAYFQRVIENHKLQKLRDYMQNSIKVESPIRPKNEDLVLTEKTQHNRKRAHYSSSSRSARRSRPRHDKKHNEYHRKKFRSRSRSRSQKHKSNHHRKSRRHHEY